jgi:hypothetical protein
MKTLKYKVTDQRVRYISDVDALYGSPDSDNTGKVGIIQKLSAEYGKYLDESVAITEQFQRSLQSGCLRKFIDATPPLIVVEEVDSSKNKTAGVVDAINSNPYNIAPLKEVIGDDGLVSGIKTVSEETRVVDWNKLTIEEKRALMKSEEVKEKERIKAEQEKNTVVDWNALSREEKIKLLSDFKEQDSPKPQELKKTRVTKKTKKFKGEKDKKGEIQGTNISNSGVLVSDITTDDMVSVQKIDTFEQFAALKYQKQLQFIATADNIQLLEEIMKNAKQDMLIGRAMKRVKALRG